MRIVVDTNVFVSGIFFTGPPHAILKAWSDRRLTIVYSPEILEEYCRILDELEKEFDNISSQPFIILLITYGELCVPRKAYRGLCRDAADEKFIACAVEGNARYIVSGDRDLLEASLEAVKIVSPRQFCNLY